MKVLGITASGRKLGNSSLLLNLAMEAAAAKGAEVLTVNLTDYHLKPCTGCMTCILKEKPCRLEDDMASLLAELQTAQGLIVAAPTYVLGPAAAAKLFLDRFFMVARQVDRQDYKGVAATINPAGLPAMNPMGELLNVIPMAYQFKLVDHLKAYGPGPGEPLLDDQIARRAKELGERVVAAGRGEGGKRPPAKNECPNCYAQTFNFTAGGKVSCSICGSSAIAVPSSTGEWELSFSPGWEDENRFTPERISRHVFDWIIGSKERYLAKLPEIMEKGIFPDKKG